MSFLVDDNLTSHHYHNHIPNPSYSKAPVILPKVGQTRCYWALLSSDLQFIYLDPVLDHHLGDQADLLVGKSLLSFVHPDEQASAKRDLGNVLDSKTLHGSVTRVRYARLSSVRRRLGYQGPGPDWIDADKIAMDKDYLAVDLVINWAADGLVLCFIHAIVDLSNKDNDEVNKTDWTNWCGTPWMPPEQLDIMYRRFLMCVQQTGSMSRVFQILQNQEERPLLISWPPDSAHGSSRDDFAKLVANIQISSGVPGESDAKTSCTRRFKALQNMPAVFGSQVESIFIPHGTIIFACHKVNPIPPRTSASMSQVDYSSFPTYYNQASQYNTLSPHEGYSNGFPSGSYSPQRWPSSSVATNARDIRTDYAEASPLTWSSTSPSPSSTPASYIQPHTGANQSSTFRTLPSTGYTTSYTSFPASGSSNNNSRPASTALPASAPPSADVIPPSRRRVSPNAIRLKESAVEPDSDTGYSGPSRRNGTPTIGVSKPSGILKCSSCKTTQSPEWRKGPSGKKELCNACGLRYARSRAKKDGSSSTPPRRRKDKSDLSKRESSTPPLYAPYPTTTPKGSSRRSFVYKPPSHSGSEMYTSHHQQHSHQSQHVANGQPTPSPPPASNATFVHYANGHGQRNEVHVPPAFSTSNNDLYSPVPQHPPHRNYSPHSPSLSSVYLQRPQSHTHHTMSHSHIPSLHQPTHSPTGPAVYENERDLRLQSPHPGQQRISPLTLSPGNVGEGYRR